MIQGKEPGEGLRGRFQSISVDPFVRGFDMQLVRPLARSIRLNGFATCLRLEQVYWDILGDMAQLNSCSISTLLSHVDREVHLRHGGVRNFQRAGACGLRGAQFEGDRDGSWCGVGAAEGCDLWILILRLRLKCLGQDRSLVALVSSYTASGNGLCGLTAAQAAFNGYNPALCRKAQPLRE